MSYITTESSFIKNNATIWVHEDGYYTVYDKCGFVADGQADEATMKTDNPAETIYKIRTTNSTPAN